MELNNNIQNNFFPIIFPLEYTTDDSDINTDYNFCQGNSNKIDTLNRILEIINYYKNLRELNNIKSNIDSLEEKEWDYLKKKCNPFECVTTNNGVANYMPISRAYFKMFEMIECFKEEMIKAIGGEENFTTLHLAEGPGGFIECLNQKLDEMNYKDYKMYGITLVKEDKSVPAWKKSNFFLEFNKNIEILNGKDGTGDLYNIDNIYDVSSKITKKASIITGDGGFDFSNDFNQQENLSFPLIYCQTLTALLSQKIGGIFILKIFDIYNVKTINLIEILKKSYRKVNIIKPYTSRPANSEKYIVCIDFLDSISKEDIHKLLLDIPKMGSSIVNKDLELHKYTSCNPKFYTCLNEINEIMFERQKKFILETLSLRNVLITDEKKEALIKNQVLTSIQWCIKYKFRINYLSKYINLYSLTLIRNRNNFD